MRRKNREIKDSKEIDEIIEKADVCLFRLRGIDGVVEVVGDR